MKYIPSIYYNELWVLKRVLYMYLAAIHQASASFKFFLFSGCQKPLTKSKTNHTHEINPSYAANTFQSIYSQTVVTLSFVTSSSVEDGQYNVLRFPDLSTSRQNKTCSCHRQCFFVKITMKKIYMYIIDKCIEQNRARNWAVPFRISLHCSLHHPMFSFHSGYIQITDNNLTRYIPYV